MDFMERQTSDAGVTDPMDRWVRRVALVTGATRGIGAAIAESLVRAGMYVVGVAPSVEKLEVSHVTHQTTASLDCKHQMTHIMNCHKPHDKLRVIHLMIFYMTGLHDTACMCRDS